MDKFVPVNLHMNNWGCMNGRALKSRAVEFSFVNKKLITLKSQTRSFAQHPLNKPNGNIRDCQMTEPVTQTQPAPQTQPAINIQPATPPPNP